MKEKEKKIVLLIQNMIDIILEDQNRYYVDSKLMMKLNAFFYQNSNYFDEDYESACDEITELKAACRDKKLKIILETGALKTAKDIKAASILSLYSGADFLKTSTGKEYPGATHEAVYIMAKCIKEYHSKTGNMVGIKISGGVTTTDEAVAYYTIVKEVLGSKWLTNKYFRIGASRLANKLLSDIIGLETNFF